MPFKSEAQRRFLWMHHPKVAREFASKTPKGKRLPYHVRKRTRITKNPGFEVPYKCNPRWI